MLRGKFDNVLKWMQLAAACCFVIAALTSFGTFVFSSQFRGTVADAVLDREEKTLADLSEVPPPTGMDELDRRAAAIYSGSGPNEWPFPDGTSVGREAVFYTRGGQWMELAYPNGGRDNSDICITMEQGQLTVVGFSRDGVAALVEYAAPGDGGGTACDTGSYFFYPVPPVSP